MALVGAAGGALGASEVDVEALMLAETERMRHADDAAAAEEEARIVAEAEKAEAATQRAIEGGTDPKTLEAVKSAARKFAAWLHLHGAGHGYREGDEVGEALLLRFAAHCFTTWARRWSWSVYGDEGLGDSFGLYHLPYLLPKFGLPLLKLPGWTGLSRLELDMKCAPVKVALKAEWHRLRVSTPLTARQRLAVEQDCGC